MPWTAENIIANLAIEIALVFGLFAGVFLTVAGVLTSSAVLTCGIIVLCGLVYFSARHIQELLKKGKKMQVSFFLTLIIVLIITLYAIRIFSPTVVPAFLETRHLVTF
jgi:hypothetical protein